MTEIVMREEFAGIVVEDDKIAAKSPTTNVQKLTQNYKNNLSTS